MAVLFSCLALENDSEVLAKRKKEEISYYFKEGLNADSTSKTGKRRG